MSRKMIDYQVENGKISTIDGYKVGADIEPTKFSVITIFGNNTVSIKAGDYTEGQTIPYAISEQIYADIYDEEQKALLKASKPILLSVNTDPAYTVYKIGTAMFSIEPIIDNFELSVSASSDTIYVNTKYSVVCIKAGTVSASDNFVLRARARVLLLNAKYIS